MHEEVYKFSSTMRGLVIRRCELGYENIILIGSYIYYLSVAPTPSYVFLLPCFCLSMQLRSCVHAIACVWFRVCSLLPLLRFLRAILSRSVTRLCGCAGLSPVVSGEYCNEQTSHEVFEEGPGFVSQVFSR
jgi:hypothetical protein